MICRPASCRKAPPTEDASSSVSQGRPDARQTDRFAATYPALMLKPFVPPDFTPPTGLRTAEFVLEPLGPRHNEPDNLAWTSSLDHIRATPGFEGSGWWSSAKGLDENLKDLEQHADDFARRSGFTYTVLDPSDADVIGCVYIYPASDDQHDAFVQSWVRASRAALDKPLWRTVSEWLARDWPFDNVEYASRD